MPQILKGFRDFLPEDMILREWIIRKIEDSFKLCGFLPLSTPAIESSELLLGKYGAEGEKLIYRFKDLGGRDVSLRYDLTVSLARVIAEHCEILKPFKRYQIGPVWRAEKPGKGRFREFYQCDVDIVGSSSPLADAEIITAGITALFSIGLKNFMVQLNHRKILNALLYAAQIRDMEKILIVLRTIDKLKKQGIEKVKNLLIEECKIEKSQVDIILEFLKNVNLKKSELFSIKEQYFPNVQEGVEGVENLYKIIEILEDGGYGEYVAIDLSIARGLDYYTGCVFEAEIQGFNDFGSIMAGGRYDRLIGEASEELIPAVGISIGIDRLFSALKSLCFNIDFAKKITVFIVAVGEGCLKESLRFLKKLRAEGIYSEISLECNEKLKKQLSYANKKGCDYVILIGEEELNKGKYILKNMKSGEQSEFTAEEIISKLKKLNKI